MKNIPNLNKVDPTNKCDICNDQYAEYYSTLYYIHICSRKCYEEFLKRYNIEIDEIALEIKNANELGEENEE